MQVSRTHYYPKGTLWIIFAISNSARNSIQEPPEMSTTKVHAHPIAQGVSNQNQAPPPAIVTLLESPIKFTEIWTVFSFKIFHFRPASTLTETHVGYESHPVVKHRRKGGITFFAPHHHQQLRGTPTIHWIVYAQEGGKECHCMNADPEEVPQGPFLGPVCTKRFFFFFHS